MQIRLLLIRHGQTKGNEEKRYIGKTDEGLSKQGARQLSEKFDKPGKVDLLFSSPMKRCLETCAILFPQKEILKIEEFREIDFGDFEGKNYQELSDDPRYQEWIDSGGTMTFPGGEARDAFIQRSVLGFQKMMSQIRCRQNKTDIENGQAEKWQEEKAEEITEEKPKEKPEEDSKENEPEKVLTAAAVVHGGTIMAVLSSAYGGDYYYYQIRAGEGYLLEIFSEGQDFQISSVKKW